MLTTSRPHDPTRTRDRVTQLSTASLRRVIDPDLDLVGSLGDGQVLPDELLSIHELPEFASLTLEQRARLAREEVASIVESGLRFEAVLMAGFSMEIFRNDDLTDPEVVYSLHEIGEETRHSRLFSRLLSQLEPTARNPLSRWRWVAAKIIPRILRRRATLDVLVLGGEEIPDLLQRKAAEHPDTDPFLREVNRYHRGEEARHLAYARAVLPSRLAEAGRVDRFLVRHIVPRIIHMMFDTLVHPGVYATVGLPTFDTWKRANKTPSRVALRHEATRPIVASLMAAGAMRGGRLTKPWCELAGVDASGALPPSEADDEPAIRTVRRDAGASGSASRWARRHGWL
ncbi:MAG: diiron oxygenase [Ilumatobacteraceae bacterium]